MLLGHHVPNHRDMSFIIGEVGNHRQSPVGNGLMGPMKTGMRLVLSIQNP